MRRRRSGFTLIELLVVVAIIALLIAILLPSLARARELAKRTACAANVSGMGKGLYTYATENADIYPIAAPNSFQVSGAAVTYWNRTGFRGGATTNQPTTTGDPAGATPVMSEMSTTRNLWQLVKTGGTSPRSFICPSSSDQADTVDNPADYWDFPAVPNETPTITPNRGWVNGGTQNEQCISYGYQVPYGSYGKPTTEVDQRMALAADKGPYGAAGGTQAAPTWNYDAAQTQSPDMWMPFNSPNHGGQGAGEGQVVLYADTHAEFQPKPVVGVGFDNIYTAWDGPAAHQTRCAGRRPSSSLASLVPQQNTDSLIYP
ncbi:MAG: prepilin-type N-terminal cleavage/methylation domain-containing protein [Planctomycetes bacterium]|nr:prepilin-type N-terminal cleavage/methylation domain-containing protein [Planctomycetota bacterium]